MIAEYIALFFSIGFSVVLIDLLEGIAEATAIGFYTGMQSMCTLLVSCLGGWSWYAFSPAVTFSASAVGTVLTAFYLAVMIRIWR